MTTRVRQPLRVALLGCGVVGSPGGAAAARARRTTSPPGSAPRSSSSGSRSRRVPRARPGRRPATWSPPTPRRSSRARRRRRRRGASAGSSRPGPLLLSAMERRSVVTANKALLAEDGATLHAAADEARRRPLLRGRGRRCDPAAAAAARVARRRQRQPGRWASSTAPPTSSSPRWTRPAPSFAEALAEAQALGYAEADPTADVEGFDAAAKAAILAGLAFHTRVTIDDVHREGISGVTAADVAAARAMGCVVKLLAIGERTRGRPRRHRPGAPGDDAAQPPAGRRCARPTTRCSSRRRPPVS